MTVVLAVRIWLVFWSFWRGSFIRLALLGGAKPDNVTAVDSEPYVMVRWDNEQRLGRRTFVFWYVVAVSWSSFSSLMVMRSKQDSSV